MDILVLSPFCIDEGGDIHNLRITSTKCLARFWSFIFKLFLVVFSRGEAYEKSLIHTVEGMVIEWSHQVQEMLKKSSAEPLLQGKNPSPLVEVEFWVARRADLESVVEQLYSDKVLKMSRLLEKSLSSYYPAYRSMLESIDDALVEARDIRCGGLVRIVLSA